MDPVGRPLLEGARGEQRADAVVVVAEELAGDEIEVLAEGRTTAFYAPRSA